MADDTTAHLGLPLPHPDHLLSQDVVRLRAALTGVDGAIGAQSATVSQAIADSEAATTQAIAASEAATTQALSDAIAQVDQSIAASEQSVSQSLSTLEAQVDGAVVSQVAYADRGTLRDTEGGLALVEGLGLFRWLEGSDEPDDDESCFATATGRWLLEAAHWDVVDTWQLPDDDARDSFDEDIQIAMDSAESRWPGRILFGTAGQAITSLAAVTQTTFTGSVTGAAPDDHVIATPPTALGGRISAFARVTDAGTVTIYLNNPSAAAQSLTAGTWRLAVIQES